MALAGALALGLGGYGVYATTLTVAGTTGSSMQAGSDADLFVTEGCQSGQVAVEEIYGDSVLDPETGFSQPARTGFAVSNVGVACANRYLSLAVKLDGTFQVVGTWQVSGTTHSFSTDVAGTTSAYSVRISASPPA